MSIYLYIKQVEVALELLIRKLEERRSEIEKEVQELCTLAITEGCSSESAKEILHRLQIAIDLDCIEEEEIRATKEVLELIVKKQTP